MAKYARFTPPVSGAVTVVEIVDFNPQGRFHPEVAALFSEVPNAVVVGSTRTGNSWTHPVPAEPEAPPPPARRLLVSPVEFKMLFSSAERIAIRRARSGETSDEVIDDWFGIIDDPRLTGVDLALQQTKDGLSYLVLKEILTPARKIEIEAGLPA